MVSVKLGCGMWLGQGMTDQIKAQGYRSKGLPVGLPVGLIALSDAGLTDMARRSAGTRVSFAPGATVQTAVQTAATTGRSVWFVQSGLLRMQRHSYDGRRQILSLSLPGEIAGYDAPLRDGMSIEAITPATLCRIDRAGFDTMLADDPLLRNDLIFYQQQQLDRILWLTWSIGALRPDERFGAFLALASRFMPYQPLGDGTGVLTMVLPRLDIADLLATTVETISRTAHRFAQTGILEIRDPAHFRILNMEKLVSLGRIGSALKGFQTGWDRRKTRLDTLFGSAPDARDVV